VRSFLPEDFVHDRYLYLPLFGVELVEESSCPEVERAARFLVWRVALRPVVKAPTRGVTGFCSECVGHEIVGLWLPIGVTAPKRFLIVDRNDPPKLFHPHQQLPSDFFSMACRLRVTWAMRSYEIDLCFLQIVAQLIAGDVVAG